MQTIDDATDRGAPRGPADAVTALCRAVQGLRRHTAAELGISASELSALNLICLSGGMTPGDIATELDVTSGSVTPILDHLAQAGYVQRSAHPTDRRRIVITARPGGQHAIAWAKEAVDSSLRAVTVELPEHDERVVADFLAAATEALHQIPSSRGAGLPAAT